MVDQAEIIQQSVPIPQSPETTYKKTGYQSGTDPGKALNNQKLTVLKQILIFGEYSLRIWYSEDKIGSQVLT